MKAISAAAVALNFASAAILAETCAEPSDVVKSEVTRTQQEYWILHTNRLGHTARIGAIFGMADNKAFCTELMNTYIMVYPGNGPFFCERSQQNR